MSKEAKVGLLLGLIFIVAIAVILKGVHRESMSELGEIKTLADSRTVTPEPMPLNAVRHLSDGGSSYTGAMGSQSGGSATGALTGGAVAANDTPAMADRLRPAGPIIYNAAPAATGVETDDIRYRTPLPGLGGRSSTASNAAQTDSIMPDPGVYQHAVQAVIDPQALNSIRPGQRSLLPAGLTELNPLTGRETVKPAPIDTVSAVRTPEPGKYTVVKGDDLSKIALKVYGPVEGRRWVNVKRIFDANSRIMKDMDQVTVDQVLSIPPLPGKPAPAVANPAGSKPAVPAAGSPAVKPAVPAPAVANGASYVVKKGDNLWSIAENSLGDGKRFKEIVALNSLANENAIKIGMKLKLPAR